MNVNLLLIRTILVVSVPVAAVTQLGCKPKSKTEKTEETDKGSKAKEDKADKAASKGKGKEDDHDDDEKEEKDEKPKKKAKAGSAEADPKADFTSVDDIKMDSKPTGKSALLHVYRGETGAEEFTAFSCEKGNHGYVKVKFTEKDRDLVRAIPTGLLQEECPRLHVEITGKTAYVNVPTAKILKVMDVEPKAAIAPPSGVDFASMDDVNFAGSKNAKGKIVEVKMWRGTDTTDKKFTGFECGRSGAGGFAYINYAPDQKDAVKSVSTSSIGTCKTVRFKLTTQQTYGTTWNGQLLEVK